MTENNDWIKLYRSILENPIWNIKPFSKGQAWIDLLIKTNYKKGFIVIRGNVIEINRGQCGWSVKKFSECWGWSRNKVNNFLKLLEDEQQIKQQKNNVTSIITVLNYESYQKKDNRQDNKKTADGQQTDSRRTADGQQTDTNKKGKESKESKESILINNNIINNKAKPKKKQFSEFVKMTEKEYQDLIVYFNNDEDIVKDWIERLDNFIGSKGDKYKSHYHTIRNWHRKNNGKQIKSIKISEQKIFLKLWNDIKLSNPKYNYKEIKHLSNLVISGIEYLKNNLNMTFKEFLENHILKQDWLFTKMNNAVTLDWFFNDAPNYQKISDTLNDKWALNETKENKIKVVI